MYSFNPYGWGQYKKDELPDSDLSGEEVFILTEGILDDGRVLGVYSSVKRAKAAITAAGWHECGADTWVCPGVGAITLQITQCSIDRPHRSRPEFYRPPPAVHTSTLSRDADALEGGPSIEAREEADTVVNQAFKSDAQPALIYPKAQ